MTSTIALIRQRLENLIFDFEMACQSAAHDCSGAMEEDILADARADLTSELTTLLQRVEKAEAENASLKCQLREAEEAVATRDDDRMALVRQRDLAEIKRSDTEHMYATALELAERQRDEAMKALRPFVVYTPDKCFEGDGAYTLKKVSPALVGGGWYGAEDFRAARNAMGEPKE